MAGPRKTQEPPRLDAGKAVAPGREGGPGKTKLVGGTGDEARPAPPAKGRAAAAKLRVLPSSPRGARQPMPRAAGTGMEAPPAHYFATLSPDPLEIRRILLQVRNKFMPLSGPETVGRLELVLAEILNNIAEHGAPDGAGDAVRRVHLSAATASGGIYCIVSDEGAEVPAECLRTRGLPRPWDPRLGLPEGGFGWFMIQNIVRKLYYGREGQRNILAFLIPQESSLAA